MEEVYASLSLLCPVTLSRMKWPARGRDCMHVACFDLHAFLSMNRSRPQWTCPVCNRPVFPVDVGIDLMVWDILCCVAGARAVTAVRLYPDGKWDVDPSRNEVEGSGSEDDDEQEAAMIANIRLGGKRKRDGNDAAGHSSKRPAIVDLTL